jgi:hypothetical protein
MVGWNTELTRVSGKDDQIHGGLDRLEVAHSQSERGHDPRARVAEAERHADTAKLMSGGDYAGSARLTRTA